METEVCVGLVRAESEATVWCWVPETAMWGVVGLMGVAGRE
jgi:hypothetical protein